MLEGLRKAQQNIFGRIIITVLFGLLIVSFGFWGISGFLGGVPQTTAVRVGKTDVSIYQYQSAYRLQMRQLERALQKPITSQDARAMNLEAQITGRLVGEAALDDRARELGLAASDEMVRQFIFSLPAFQSQSGGFNRAAFDIYLRNAEMSEADFVKQQRAALLRNQIATSLSAEMPVPKALQEIAFRTMSEYRNIAYFVLGEADIGTLPTPTTEQLNAVFQENKAQFRAPEFRSFEALAITPTTIQVEAVSDDEARKVYDQLKNTRYISEERRTVQQIVFPSEADARAALDRLNTQNVTFESLATEHNMAPEALTIGNLTRKEFLDQKVADAAFALDRDKVSDPVQTRFGFALIRVTAIDNSGFRSFEDVASEIKASVSLERAQEKVDRLRDDIEDMVANARPLAEIAKEKNLSLIEVKAIDKTGQDAEGNPVANLPDERLVNAVFASDIGVDNDTLRTQDGGYIWFQVMNVTPSRDRSLEEVATQVTQIWRQSEISSRLADLASKQVERITSAEELAKVAAELKLQSRTIERLGRSQSNADFGTEGIARLFATPVGKAASVAQGNNRVVFLVTSAEVPAPSADASQIKQMNDQLASAIGYDLLIEYITRTQADLGVTVNQQVINRAVGGDS